MIGPEEKAALKADAAAVRGRLAEAEVAAAGLARTSLVGYHKALDLIHGAQAELDAIERRLARPG